MGKIRVRTLGDEQKEKKDKKKAQQRAASKKPVLLEDAEVKKVEQVNANPVAKIKEAAELENSTAADSKVKQATSPTQKQEKKPKQAKKQSAKKQTHSESYKTVAGMVDKNKKYSLKEALEILPKLKRAKFDETVELHINTLEQSVSGNVTLPHGTGKKVRIEIVNQADDAKHVEEVVKKVETGNIDFDVLIATPDSMSKLAKIARFLGPRGLMPNPKNGTVTQKPNDVAKKFQGGQINFKTEGKFPILHMSVGKVSFGEKKLADNIQSAIAAVQTKNIKNITLKSTMSPGIKIDTVSI